MMPAALETVACALCGSSRSTALLVARDLEFDGSERFHIVGCTDCGLRFLNPRPDRASIGRYYPTDYYTHHRLDAAQEARIYRHPLGLVQRWAPAGALLDIGTGDGAFLALLRAEGDRDLVGLESDPRAWKIACEDRGLDVRLGAFPETPIQGSGFSAVTLLETIEHLHAPVEGLRQVRELLAPGGRLILSTPNILAFEMRLLGARSISLQVPRHLYFFSAASLAAACEAAGLRVLHHETSAATDGLTRSIWLAFRRRGRPALAGGLEAPEPGFRARSWRRQLHGILDRLLWPLAGLLARRGLGPTIFLVAERPAHG
jgi:SAM-dependent methyltransferase